MSAEVLLRVTLLLVSLGIASPCSAEWLKGDLHSHSLHSDGDSPVWEVIASAESRGLEFFALTDHDSSMGPQPTHWDDPDYRSDQMVLLYGVEWTTGGGHACVWAETPFDYSGLWQGHLNLSVEETVAAAHAQGALFSINHPTMLRIGWRFPVVEGIDCVEVWNGPLLVSFSHLATHEFWDEQLMAGRRLTGVGGSDTHHLQGWMAPFTGHGQPTTWVDADQRTPGAILAAIQAGHVSISFAPWAARLELTADVDGDGAFETRVGDNVAASGQPVMFQVRIVGDPTGGGRVLEFPHEVVDRIRRDRVSFWDLLWMLFALRSFGHEQPRMLAIVKNAQLHAAWFTSGDARTLTFSDTPATDGRTYYRAELYGGTNMRDFINLLIYGARLATTNPVYFNF